jgi:hypothetical protein
MKPKTTSINRGIFKRGDIITGRVRMARTEGIVLAVEGVASAIVATKGFGRGEKRRQALARIATGSIFEARVVAYYPSTRHLSLEPTESALSGRTVVPVPFGKGVRWVLCDVGNVLGALGPERAARKLAAIRNGAEAQGWRARFFWEREGYTWTAKLQATEGQVDALRRFVREAHVALVEGEADWPLLETCRELPGSVIVTRDRFTDKGLFFPDIIGTERVRPFFFKEESGTIFFGVDGLLEPISIDVDVEDGEEETSESTAAVLAQGECLLRRGEGERAARVFAQLADRGAPEGYSALEDLYVATDRKRAKRISRAERRQADKARDLARRHARQRAWRRSGVGLGAVRRVARSRWAEKANWRSLCA